MSWKWKICAAVLNWLRPKLVRRLQEHKIVRTNIFFNNYAANDQKKIIMIEMNL